MIDSRSGYEDEQLPWLEAVDDEDGPRGVSGRKMLGALLVVLAAAVIVAGTFFWLGRHDPVGIGGPELIRAEPGPYKIKPSDPGGLDVAGESGTAYATSAGEQPDAQLDLSAVPEEPVARAKAAEPAPAAEPDAKAEAAPATPSGPPGSTIQLGFYPSQAAANSSWDALSGRFPAVAGASKLVVPYQSGFRLRAGFGSPADAGRACQLLKVAGEACFVVR